jgi:ABC-type spermidine/putrescine transport system permease subunit II
VTPSNASSGRERRKESACRRRCCRAWNCSAILPFIVWFGDIDLALFLSGPGVTTIPVYTFSSLMFQAQPDIATVSPVQITIVALRLLVLGKTVGLGRS